MNYGLGGSLLANSFFDCDTFWSTLMKDIVAESVAVSITIPQYIMVMEFIFLKGNTLGFITFLFSSIRCSKCKVEY